MEGYRIEKNDLLSLHSFHTDSGICIDDAPFIVADVLTDLDTGNSVHFMPSIENLVGEAWLVFAKWADEICDWHRGCLHYYLAVYFFCLCYFVILHFIEVFLQESFVLFHILSREFC